MILLAILYERGGGVIYYGFSHSVTIIFLIFTSLLYFSGLLIVSRLFYPFPFGHYILFAILFYRNVYHASTLFLTFCYFWL